MVPLTIISPHVNCTWNYVVSNHDNPSKHFFTASLRCCLVVVWFLHLFHESQLCNHSSACGEGKRYLSRARVLRWESSHSLPSPTLVMTRTRKYYYYSHFTEEETEAWRLRFLLKVAQGAGSLVCHYLLQYTAGPSAGRRPMQTTPTPF